MKKIALLTLTCSGLLLASCGRTNAPTNLTNLSGMVVEGNLEVSSNGALTLTTGAWTGGAGSVLAFTVENDGPENIVTTPLAADGKFSFDLPATPAASSLTPVSADVFSNDGEDCQGNVNVSDTGARVAPLLVGVDTAAKDGPIFPVSVKTTVDSAGKVTGGELALGFLLYADRSVTLRGTQTCTATNGFTYATDLDLTLSKGWNKLSLATQGDVEGTLTKVVVRSGSYPNNWVYLGDDLGAVPLGTQSLKSLKLPFLR